VLAALRPDAPGSLGRKARSHRSPTDGTDVTRQAVAKHLRVLADAGLARGERRGREQVWRLTAERLDEARRSLERIAQRWDDALLRPKAAVEEE
jgi:DNA-binding transcriptional ArsR family regulator